MKFSLRIECPHCNWGHLWRDAYINQGWLVLQCGHCGEEFFTKVSIPTVDIQVEKILPEGVPCSPGDKP